MPPKSVLQDRYPNRNGIFTALRDLTSADLDVQIRLHESLAQQHNEHAQALSEYRDHVFDQSRHGR